jgi:hypothetical protein
MKSPTSLQGTVLFNGLLVVSLSWGVSRQNIKNMKSWMEKQHLVLWRGPCSTKTGSRINLWPRPGYKGPIIVL